MALDFEYLQFGGMMVTIAEKEMSASLTDDTDEIFVHYLFKKYEAAGKPKNKRTWIRQELKKYFLSVVKPPAWIERTTIPKWPFFQGKPMVFIEQLTVPETGVSKTAASPGVVLYVFGGRATLVDIPGGWESIYRVVEQVQDL